MIKKKLILLTAASSLLFTYACNNNVNDNNNVDNTDTVSVNMNANTNTAWQVERDNYRIAENKRIDSLRAIIHSEDSTYEKTHKKDQDWEMTKVKINRELDSLQTNMQQLGDKAENEWSEFKYKTDARLDTIQYNWKNYKEKKK